jgi:chemotaxis protein MotB
LDDARPVIIKKVVKGGGDGHHGGAWKVAYADFVTAMMAFFLLMWLLNATSEEQRKGLADYFDPSLPISRVSAGGAGMLGGDTMFVPQDASGSRQDGIRAQPTDDNPGEDLGNLEASPDMPEGETAPDTMAATGTEGPGQNQGQTGETGDADGSANDAATRELRVVGENLLDQVLAAGDAGLLDHFSMRMTPEGLLIEIVDITDSALYRSGAAEPEPVLATLIDILVPVLNMTTNDIAVAGHTDASPFTGRQDYSNWELSSDRANAARRLMSERGLPAERIVRVSGRAATSPISADPLAPKNRRIAITLLRSGI